MLKQYLETFKYLRNLDAEQFRSDISASQYILSYKLAEKYINPDSKVLDWGAGNGHFSYFLLKSGYKATGFSIQEESELSKQLKTEYPDKYTIVISSESVVRLPFGDETFDAAVSIGVLEHVREAGGKEVDSLKEIKRILKPGGIFICTHLPNKYSWIEFITSRMKNKYHHIYKYKIAEMKSIVEQSGLKLLEIERYGFLARLMFSKYQTSHVITDTFNFADKLLSFLFNLFDQNIYFVLKK